MSLNEFMMSFYHILSLTVVAATFIEPLRLPKNPEEQLVREPARFSCKIFSDTFLIYIISY